jgi:hypothetical protein
LVCVSINLRLPTWNKSLIQHSRRDWNLQSSEYPALEWYDLQGMLEKAKFDVLLILDCCHAAGAVTKGSTGTMEVLAGCSRENKAAGPWGSCSVIGSPFTQTLIKHLEESSTRPHGLLMTELQTLLSLDKVLEDQSPIHVVLTGHYSPIKLRPLFPERELKEMENRTSQIIKPEMKALLSISFRGNTLPDMEEFVHWLNSQYPKEVARIEVERVNIEASFDSCSTLMLLSIPISMWAYLQESLGCSLVGFVESRNVLIEKYHGIQKVVATSSISTARSLMKDREGLIPVPVPSEFYFVVNCPSLHIVTGDNIPRRQAETDVSLKLFMYCDLS